MDAVSWAGTGALDRQRLLRAVVSMTGVEQRGPVVAGWRRCVRRSPAAESGRRQLGDELGSAADGHVRQRMRPVGRARRGPGSRSRGARSAVGGDPVVVAPAPGSAEALAGFGVLVGPLRWRAVGGRAGSGARWRLRRRAAGSNPGMPTGLGRAVRAARAATPVALIPHGTTYGPRIGSFALSGRLRPALGALDLRSRSAAATP